MTKVPYLWFIVLLSLVSASSGHDLAKLERSFWLNASLAVPKLGYWGTSLRRQKPGKPYNGFYAQPWREVCDIFQTFSAGKTP